MNSTIVLRDLRTNTAQRITTPLAVIQAKKIAEIFAHEGLLVSVISPQGTEHRLIPQKRFLRTGLRYVWQKETQVGVSND